MNTEKTSVNWYAHGARYYDPQLAVWHSPDPLSELYSSSSTYAYVINNPVNFYDPNGMKRLPAPYENYNNCEGFGPGARRLQADPNNWSNVGRFMSDPGPGRPYTDENGNTYTPYQDPISGGYYYWQSETKDTDKTDVWIRETEGSYEKIMVRSIIHLAYQVFLRPNSSGRNTGWEPLFGAIGGVMGDLYFSERYGTWMGKNFQVYSQTWGGNGITGGKFKFGKKVKTGIKIGGYGLGVWNAYKVNQLRRNGEISEYQMYMEQGSNLITTTAGPYGLPWAIGWELGRTVTLSNAYQETKFNFFYNKWEKRFGAPSKSNESYWYYFFQNYGQ